MTATCGVGFTRCRVWHYAGRGQSCCSNNVELYSVARQLEGRNCSQMIAPEVLTGAPEQPLLTGVRAVL